MNSKDFTKYAYKSGFSITYAPVKGLSDKTTMDGTRHIDVITYKRSVTIKLNPATETVAGLIIAEYASSPIYLTIFDIKTGLNATFLCEPTSTIGEPAMVRSGVAVYYQVGDLTFLEL
jgi:hypothetical protein